MPFLPTERLRRKHPPSPSGAPDEAPLVLTEKVGGALLLAAVDAKARALGLAPGQKLADARACLPTLVALEHDGDADRRFLERLADAADRYTPLVALEPPEGFVLDITGCAHLFGGEAALRSDLLRRLAGAGLTARAT
ncbi:MAG: Y-family DNA polymerase, partial [Phreatobacter sp.]